MLQLVLSCAVEAGKQISLLHVGRVQITCGLLPTLFLQYSYKTIILSKKVKFQVCLLGK